MIKEVLKQIIPAAKWLMVAGATAAVVISVQVSADDEDKDKATAAVADGTSLPISEPAALLAPSNSWTPANGFADLIESVNPAVVHVSTSGYIKRRSTSRRGQPDFNDPRDFFRRFFEGNPFPDERYREEEPEPEQDDTERDTRPLGIGSGFIISDDGYVVTNHHVIDKADEIVVTLPNGDEYDAVITGSDPKTDLALLKLKSANNMPYVSWGDDKVSRVGDWVLAIGNPFGLGGSASTGIISALGRDIRSGPYDDFIQVDAAINRGNSGDHCLTWKEK